MSRYLSNIEIKKITKDINKQKGQKYPCSNQVVICAYFTDYETYIKDFTRYMRNNQITKCYNGKYDSWFELKNGERWKYFNSTYNCRGYRFYKLKVSTDVQANIFFENIYPYCSLYTTNIRFIGKPLFRIYRSNNLLEAIKMKIYYGSYIKLIRNNSNNTNNLPRVMWLDKMRGTIVNFQSVKPIDKWWKRILYQGYIVERPVETFIENMEEFKNDKL